MYSDCLGHHLPADHSMEPTSLSSPSQRAPDPENGRPRGNPSITPRKFKRFFTPRTQPVGGRRTRRVLFAADNLRNIQSSPIRPTNSFDQENEHPEFPRQFKRQKLSNVAEVSGEADGMDSKTYGSVVASVYENTKDQIPSSPCPRGRRDSIDSDVATDEGISAPTYSKPVARWTSSAGLSGQLFDLSLRRPKSPDRRHPISDWRDDTGKFYSRPEDVHDVMSLESGAQRRTIPFVAVGMNKNALLAVGDEEGRVRILETGKRAQPPFKKSVCGFRPHTNAVIDMAFSDDDLVLATASGDQSARVIDMSTQTTTAILGVHNASLKQVRFQPGFNNSKVLATSSRDGSVQIWDTRCKGFDGPQCRMWTPVEDPTRPRSKGRVLYPRPVNSLLEAHRTLPGQDQPHTAGWTDLPSRGEASSRSEGLGRSSDVSVTAIQFLTNGFEHMLLSACEADASVKLWDIRSHSSKHRTLPVAATALPTSHIGFRDFGIGSLDLSSDGSRFYALCKDNTVYAYSTSQLLLGQSPVEDASTNPRKLKSQFPGSSPGPLYGLRHRMFHANTFYVKSALRKLSSGNRSEVIAVGSSDNCVVLFPTDERHISRLPVQCDKSPSLFAQSIHRPGSTPVHQFGTALIRGHDREVGSVAWTCDGELATVGDDLSVRMWREDYDTAKDLRVGGETDGRRWNCGWADVGSDFDDDDMEC